MNWLKNIHTNEVEEFTGKIERTTLSLWLQERARRKLATPEKHIEELTRAKAASACHRADSNYCVIAFYRDNNSKEDATRLLQPFLSKYKDDPVTFWTVDSRSLRSDCPAEGMPQSTFAVYVFRSKRNKYEDGRSDRSTVASKIDYALSGNMLAGVMTAQIADCFI